MEAGVPVILALQRRAERPVRQLGHAPTRKSVAPCARIGFASGSRGGRVIVLQSEPAMGESSLWLQGVRRLESRP